MYNYNLYSEQVGIGSTSFSKFIDKSRLLKKLLVYSEEIGLEDRLESIQDKELRTKGKKLHELFDANWLSKVLCE